MRGYEEGGQHIHIYTYSSWSQKSAAGGGAGRPQGGGGWEWLVDAVLGWSRPAGAVPGLQPPGYGLQAQSLSPRLALWSPLLTQGQCSPMSKP